VSITIRSDSFDNGAPIPARFTADGENISPPLNWNGLPAGTRELALIVDGRGAGSTFVVVCLRRQYCRLCDEVRLHPSVVAAGATQEAAVADLIGVKVLVVEEDPDGRALLRRVLVDAGAEVSDADDARDALERVLAFRPNIVVSDIGMPILDGYDLIKEIRSRGFTSQMLPAIALTAFARTEDRRRAMLSGYQIHLSKPVDPAELTAAIAMLTGRTG